MTSCGTVFLFLKVIVYFYSRVCMLCQHQGRKGVPCPPLVLPRQAQWSPCCLYTSLVVAPVPLSALESLCFFYPLSRCSVPILGWGGVVGWWWCVVLTWIAPIPRRLPITFSAHWFCLQVPMILEYTGGCPEPTWWQSYSWRIHTSLSRVASTLMWGDWLSFSG